MPSDFDALIPASPPRDSLLAVANKFVDNGDGAGDRWIAGFEFRPESCGTVGAHWTYLGDNGSTPDTKDIGTTPIVQRYQPYTAWVGEKCSPLGNNDWFVPYATRALAACLSVQIERELWDGAVAVEADYPNRYLAMPGTVVTPANNTPLGVVTAVAEIEQALAECSCGGVGMIHAQPRMVTHMENHQLVKRDNGRLITANGTLVVRGTGYSGSGPDGDPTGHANHSWIFGTSMISTFTGPVSILPGDIAEAVNRETNLVEYRAEREVAAVWDGCCHVGVKVDHNATRTAHGS